MVSGFAMRFDLVDLQLFVAVADSGSITHGAMRAHLALASASARIKGLEADLGWVGSECQIHSTSDIDRSARPAQSGGY